MEGPLKKTRVSYKARLDSRLTSQYLLSMQEVELVKKSEYDDSLYVVTQKGLEFRNRLDEIIEMLDMQGKSMYYQLE